MVPIVDHEVPVGEEVTSEITMYPAVHKFFVINRIILAEPDGQSYAWQLNDIEFRMNFANPQTIPLSEDMLHNEYPMRLQFRTGLIVTRYGSLTIRAVNMGIAPQTWRGAIIGRTCDTMEEAELEKMAQ